MENKVIELEDNYRIQSIKRISDGEVFNIGDTISDGNNTGDIQEIRIVKDVVFFITNEYRIFENVKKLINNNYFIPDVEDLRIGYKCELYIEDSWQEATLIDVTKVGLKFNSFDKKKEWIFTNVDNTVIKTHYLTKEQIESEGWKVIDDKNPTKFKHPVEVDVQVIYDFKYHYLWITIPANHFLLYGQELEYRANKYAGECKSINEFRWICKLLKI